MSNIKVTTNGLFNPPIAKQPSDYYVIGKARRVGYSWAARQHLREVMEYYDNN